MKAVGIIWDVDYEEDLELLPKEIEIPDLMTDEDEISDYLSDTTGYCHEDSKKAAETLDKYDFTPILKRCYGVDIYDIEDWIKDYGDDVAEAVENLADYELADYLHQKYGMGIQEVSRYCAWWNDRKQGGIM